MRKLNSFALSFFLIGHLRVNAPPLCVGLFTAYTSGEYGIGTFESPSVRGKAIEMPMRDLSCLSVIERAHVHDRFK